MLALLANCVGHMGAMSGAFSRFWSRTAKRRQKGGGGSLDAVDDAEFVRVQGRAAGCKTKSEDAGQHAVMGWAEARESAFPSTTMPTTSQPQQLPAPLIRIEQSSESPEPARKNSDAEGGRRRSRESIGGSSSGVVQQQLEKASGAVEKEFSFSSVELRSHRSQNSTVGSAGIPPRPSSSIHGESDIQMCLGRPCARLRLSVQYSEQKKLLILTLHELAQTEELWMLERQDDRAALQVRLALLTDSQQPQKVQKFQSKFQPLDQFQVHYGQTFAFDCAKEQLAGSVVRLRLYRKSRDQRRPQCLGVAFLRNYLVDVEARKAQNHFLQFRRSLVEPKSSAKGSMSLFPSLLSLTHSHHQNNSQPKSPPSALAIPNTSAFSTGTNNAAAPTSSSSTLATHQQSSIPATPQSASSSRRGSTVDESGRFCSLPQLGSNQPEVLVSLCYFEVQNRLVVGVQKAAAIGALGRKEEGQEVFIRINALSPNGAERGKQKSENVRATPSGETQFNVQAAFNIPRTELAHSSIQVHLFAMHGAWPLKRKQRIGTLTLSQQEEHCTSPDAQTHWKEMIQGMGITVDKWHMLEPADMDVGK